MKKSAVIQKESQTIKEMSNFDRNIMFEKCFELGLNHMLESVDVSVRNVGEYVILTERPVLSSIPKHSFFYLSVSEKSRRIIENELRLTFKHIYISNLSKNNVDYPGQIMYEQDMETINQSVAISCNQMVVEGLISNDNDDVS